jgi:hypothetical protein
LTGGTVLSEFYLKHRESHDIDLFSENQEIHLPSINKFIGIVGSKMFVKKIIHRQFLGLHTYTLFFPDGELKVDFNYYPFNRIEKRWKIFFLIKPKNWGKIYSNSLLFYCNGHPFSQVQTLHFLLIFWRMVLKIVKS